MFERRFRGLLACLIASSLVACAVESESFDYGAKKKSRAKQDGTESSEGEEDIDPIAGATGDGGTTTPTGPGGFNLGPNVAVPIAAGASAFALGTALPAAAGAKITATFAVTPASGGSKGSVSLSNIMVDNASTTALRFVRPTFLVQTAADETVAQVSFADVDLTIPAGRKSPFPKLTVVVDGADAKLRLVFGSLKSTTATVIAGLPADIYEECKSPTAFAPVGRAWTQNNCKNCHAGLFPFDYLATDPVTGCGLSKRLLRTGGPNLARPTQGAHSGGVMPNAGAYSQALNAWRAAEQ